MELSESIDILDFDNLNKEYFNKNYIEANKPAIIKGLLRNTIAGKTWSLENLRERIGKYPIKAFNVNEKNGTGYLFAKHKLQLNDMFDLIETNAESDYRMFVNPIMKKDKRLQTELPIPDFFKCKFQLSNLLFIGGKGCTVPFHYDFIKDNGLLTHFFGTKEIILVDPSQSDLLYRLPLNSISMVNMFDPDYETYPALKKVKAIKATLNHGDTLFIPSGYWHHIKYVDASMSVAFRKWDSNPIRTYLLGTRIIVQVTIDKTLAFLMPKKWLKFKQDLAKKRAEKD